MKPNMRMLDSRCGEAGGRRAVRAMLGERRPLRQVRDNTPAATPDRQQPARRLRLPISRSSERIRG